MTDKEYHKVYQRRWRRSERGRVSNSRSQQSYHVKNPGLKSSWGQAYQRRKVTADPTYYRERALQGRYGLSILEWEKLRDSQGGVCAICGRLSKNGGLVVDHCHATGVIRGLLCHNCNLTLGKFDDRPEWFDLAARYLRSFPQGPVVSGVSVRASQ